MVIKLCHNCLYLVNKNRLFFILFNIKYKIKLNLNSLKLANFLLRNLLIFIKSNKYNLMINLLIFRRRSK